MGSFFNFFDRLFDNNSSPTNKKTKRRNHRISRIEELESRDMLSVSPWIHGGQPFASAPSDNTGVEIVEYRQNEETIGLAPLADLAEPNVPSFTSQPQSATYTKGQTATPLNATASGNGDITYKWYRNDGTGISGATSSTYTPQTSTASSTGYYCIATNTLNGVSKTARSNTATISVKTAPNEPTLTLQPQSAAYTKGQSASALSVNATGNGDLTYQWYRNGDVITLGGTYKTYTPSTSTVGSTQYYCIVTNRLNGLTSTTQSDTATITVKESGTGGGGGGTGGGGGNDTSGDGSGGDTGGGLGGSGGGGTSSGNATDITGVTWENAKGGTGGQGGQGGNGGNGSNAYHAGNHLGGMPIINSGSSGTWGSSGFSGSAGGDMSDTMDAVNVNNAGILYNGLGGNGGTGGRGGNGGNGGDGLALVTNSGLLYNTGWGGTGGRGGNGGTGGTGGTGMGTITTANINEGGTLHNGRTGSNGSAGNYGTSGRAGNSDSVITRYGSIHTGPGGSGGGAGTSSGGIGGKGSGIITTANIQGGTLNNGDGSRGSGSITTANVYSGTLNNRSTGTITTMDFQGGTVNNAGTIDHLIYKDGIYQNGGGTIGTLTVAGNFFAGENWTNIDTLQFDSAGSFTSVSKTANIDVQNVSLTDGHLVLNLDAYADSEQNVEICFLENFGSNSGFSFTEIYTTFFDDAVVSGEMSSFTVVLGSSTLEIIADGEYQGNWVLDSNTGLVSKVLSNWAAPTNLHCTEKTEDSITLVWNHANNAIRYEVFYSADGINWSSENVSISGTSAVVSGLTANISYQFQVRAQNNTNNSVWSDIFETATTPAMSAPTNPKFTFGEAGNVTLEWDVVPVEHWLTDTDGENPNHLYRYNIRYSTDDGATWSYWYHSTTNTEGVSSTFSTEHQDWYDGVDRGHGIADATDSNISFQYVPSGIDHTGLSTSGVYAEISGVAVMGLDPTKTYTFQIAGHWSRSDSDVSGINGAPLNIAVDMSMSVPPPTPVGLWSTETENGISLTWDPVVSATSYEIQWKRSDDSDFVPWTGTINGASANLTGLTVGTFYQFQVRAKNNAGESDWSEIIFIVPTVSTPALPSVPGGLGSTKTENSISLTWDAVANATGYEIQWKRPSDSDFVPWMGAVNGTSANFTGLTVDTLYQFQVRAKNDAGKSGWSEILSVTTDAVAPPVTPTNLKAEPTASRNVNLTWNAVPGATSYQIYLKLADGTERLLGTVTDTKYTTEPLPVGENTLRVYALAEGVKSDAAEVTTMIKATVTPTAPYGSTFNSTSEYMIGDVYVTLVLLESDGTIDADVTDWTSQQITHVKSEVTAGLQWWEDMFDKYNPNSQIGLDFILDTTYADNPFETSYEPINTGFMPQNLYIGEFLVSQGYAGDYSTDQAHLPNLKMFNDEQRNIHNTDWAVTIFVVNSRDQSDEEINYGEFADGGSAYAWLGGPSLITTYDCNGWGEDAMEVVIAHEIAHSFWALDEYPGINSYTERSGYYNTQNTNAYDDNPNPDSRVHSITGGADNENDMFTAFDNYTSSPSSLEMIGWKDTDGDGILDVLDVPMTLTGSGNYNDSTDTFRFTGRSSVAVLTNQNPNPDCEGDDITLNTVDKLQYQLDGGAWTTLANTYGGDIDVDVSADVTFTGIAAGTHTLVFRTLCERTGVVSSKQSFTFVSNNVAINSDQEWLDNFLAVHTDLDKYIVAWTNGRITGINLYGEGLTGTLDVSVLNALEFLECGDNQLTSLNVSGCTALQELWCGDNQLVSLNVSGCTNLQKLTCSGNQLTSLEVSDLTNLQDLYCYGNQLTSLDVSGCTNLNDLYCTYNLLSSLDVSSCVNLQYLTCTSNQLTSLNVSDLTNLQALYCASNPLSSVNVSGCTNLTTLHCNNNQLTSLNVSGLTNLQDLTCTSNQLTSLNVSGCTNLKILYYSYNRLTSLVVSDYVNLQELGCSYNQLTSLDVSGFTNLKTLYCAGNQLTSLDISGCTNLEFLQCSSNQLTSLNVSSFTKLRTLDCHNNQLTSLDLNSTGFVGYTAVKKENFTDEGDYDRYIYTYLDGTQGVLQADAATEIILDTTVSLESFSVAQPTCDETGAVTMTWSELGSDYYYRVSKAGRIVGDYDAATFTDTLAEGEIGSYTVIAMRKGAKDQSDAITVVAWSPSVRALDDIQIRVLNGEHVQLTWTAQSDMTYTVYRAGRIVSMPNFSGGTWTDTEPFQTVSNLYHIVARYKDDNGDTQITYSNTYTVKMSPPFASPASVRDEFWTRYGQTQEDLLTLEI